MAMDKKFDLLTIFKDLGTICLTEAKCQKCAGENCLVGYSKVCAAQCRIKEQSYVIDGFKNIPPLDIRGGYDEYEVLHAIAHLLLQCRSCKDNHYNDCLINVIRSCLEVIEFGEEQEYEGEVLSYLLKIGGRYPDKAKVIADEYTMKKEESK